MLTWFLVKCPGSYNHLHGKTISFIYTRHLDIIVAFSYEILFVSSCFWVVFVHASSFVEMLSLCFIFPNGLWFKMQTGQQVAITVACSCEMMLVPVCSVLIFFFFSFLAFVMFVLMFNNYVHGDYPYMPHSKRANISETGLQSVSGTDDLERLLCQTWK